MHRRIAINKDRTPCLNVGVLGKTKRSLYLSYNHDIRTKAEYKLVPCSAKKESAATGTVAVNVFLENVARYRKTRQEIQFRKVITHGN